MIRRTAFALSLGLGLALGLLWLLSSQNGVALADPGILYVAPGGDCGGAIPCYATVQAAVDAANAGDEIRVAEGTYTGVQNVPSLSTATFTATQIVAITKSVTIQGGYTTANWTTPDPAANSTTLDAQGLGRVMVITGTIAPTVEGLRLTGGDATGLGGSRWGYDAGGGLYVYKATAIMNNCTVNSSTASAASDGYGGGLYLRYASATLSGNTIISNKASTGGHGYGGGLYLHQSHHVTLKDNTISGNTDTTSGNGAGSGLYLHSSDYATLDGNTISNNIDSVVANSHGGGLYLLYGDHLLLTGNTIQGNLASAGWGWGGGLYLASSSNLTLTGNVIINNAATSNPLSVGRGGALYIKFSGPFTLTNNVIAGNNATTAGSALWLEGVSWLPTAGQLLHTTIADNFGSAGIEVGSDSVNLSFTNTVIAGHVVGITVTSGSTVTLNATLWHGNSTDWGGAGTINHSSDHSGDPAFSADGYHLTFDSAAIDAGVDAGVTTDIDGEARPDGCFFDIGADEYITGVECKRIYLPLVLSEEI